MRWNGSAPRRVSAPQEMRTGERLANAERSSSKLAESASTEALS
jgi:hypothetical protein